MNQTALKLNDQYGRAYLNLSLILLTQNKQKESLDALAEAGRLLPLCEYQFHKLKASEENSNLKVNRKSYTTNKEEFKWIFWYLFCQGLTELREDMKSELMTCSLAVKVCSRNFYAQLITFMILVRQKKHEEIPTPPDTLVKMNSKHFFPEYFTGMMIFNQEDMESAKKVFERALEINPKSTMTLYHLANIALKELKYEESFEILQLALEVSPEHVEVLYGIGFLTETHLDKLEEAEAAYRRVTEILPENDNVLLNLGGVLVKQGKLEDALKIFEKASDLAPQNATIFYNIGNTLYQLERDEEALKAFEKALEFDPKYVDAIFETGCIHYNADDLTQAEEAFRKATEIDSQFINGFYHLGLCLKGQDKVEEALATFKIQLDLDLNSICAYSEIFSILISDDQLLEASCIAKQAVRNVPKNPFGYEWLAQVMDKLGRSTLSKQMRSKAIKLAVEDSYDPLVAKSDIEIMDKHGSLVMIKGVLI